MLFGCCWGEGQVTSVGFMLTVVETVPIAWRRRFPIAVLLITGSAAVGQVLLRSPVTDFGTFGVLVAMYTVAAESSQAVAILVAVVTPAGILAAGSLDRSTPPHALMIVFVEFASAWVLGEIRRHRRREVAVRAARIRRKNETRAQEVAAAERRRMARELHDVLAHSLSLISIQAGAARSVMDTAPEGVRACLLSIETVSADAWAEMRQFLDGGPEPETAVTSLTRPGLERVSDLIKRLEGAGLSIDLAVTGQARRLSADADLCAYRIVQESLTNALRHGGEGRTRVSVRYGQHEVELDIASQTTQLRRGPMRGGSHHGLAGMRERVKAIGGQLSVDQGAGRFTVKARLPLQAAS